MLKTIKIACCASIACALLVSLPSMAEEPHPQSHEAIKKMGDELEAARKEREAGRTPSGEAESEQKDAGSAPAQEPDLAQLKQQCEEAREKYLAPEKQSAIDECIAKKVKSPTECERFYKDFGGAGITQSGSFRQRRFHNIPECQAYYDAEKKAMKDTR